MFPTRLDKKNVLKSAILFQNCTRIVRNYISVSVKHRRDNNFEVAELLTDTQNINHQFIFNYKSIRFVNL